MGRIRITGTLLVLALLVGATVASTASAEPPELGRCVKVEPVQEGKKMVYNGVYSAKNCITQNAKHKGKYEWLPGPGEKNKFYGVASEPEPFFETTGGVKVECSVIVFEGEYTGAKTQTVSLHLGGCTEGKVNRPCQTNPAKEGEIDTVSAIEGELGVVSKSGKKTIPGWDLKHEGAILTFQCGKLPEVFNLQTIEGSVIGAVAGGGFSNLNKMNIFSETKFKAVKGLQVPEMFEGGVKDTLTTNFITEKTSEQTGFTANEEATSGPGNPIETGEEQEPLEIKAK